MKHNGRESRLWDTGQSLYKNLTYNFELLKLLATPFLTTFWNIFTCFMQTEKNSFLHFCTLSTPRSPCLKIAMEKSIIIFPKNMKKCQKCHATLFHNSERQKKVGKCHTHAHIYEHTYTQMAAISRDFAFHTYCRFIDSAPRSHSQKDKHTATQRK